MKSLTTGSHRRARPELVGALRAFAGDLQTWTRRVAIALGFAIPLSTAADGILSALLLLLWLVGGRYREKLEAIRASPVAIAALAMLAIIVAGLLWGHVPLDERLTHLRKYGNLILIPVLISVPIDEVSRRRALLAFTLAAGITLLLSFALAASLLPEWSWIKGTSQDPSIFKSRITQGLLMAFAILSAYTLARTSSRRWFGALMAALAIAAAINVLTMLQSRTGYVVLFAVLALLMFARFRWKGLLALALVAAVAFAMLYQRSERFHERMAEVTSEFAEWRANTRAEHSVVYRMEFYTNTLRIIAAHPWVGVGTGGFRTAYREQVQGTTMVPTGNPHNLYLLVASETGILGLLLLLWLLFRLWQWAMTRPSPPSVSLTARGLVLMYAVAGLFNALLIDHTESVLFGWAAGLLFAVAPLRAREGPNPERTEVNSVAMSSTEGMQQSELSTELRSRPSFTVVTPVFNMKDHLKQTIDSVLRNLRPGDQYFVIDGGSTDGTVDIIKAHASELTGWVSEPDRGYADAIHKGFDRATSEVLCWINCGDLLLPGALDRAGAILNDRRVDFIFGDDFYIDEDGRVISFSRGYVQADLGEIMLFGGWTPLQDACFWRRELYQRIGGIDVSLAYAADYDLFLRMALRGSVAYAPVAFSAFRRHPGQKSISGSNAYRLERTAVRRRELVRLEQSAIVKKVSSLWYWIAVRWRVRVTQKSWRRADLHGTPIQNLECGVYWPPRA